jgi:hypothetical protein
MKVFKIKLNAQLANYLKGTPRDWSFKGGLKNLKYSIDRMLEVFKSDFDTNKDRVLSEVEKEEL